MDTTAEHDISTMRAVLEAAIGARGRGGLAALAAHCGVRSSTVDGWRRHGIPGWHHAAVCAYLAEHGIEVSAEHMARLAALRRTGKRHPLEGAQ